METAFHYPSPCAVPFFFKKKRRGHFSSRRSFETIRHFQPQSLSAPNWFRSPFSYFLHNNYAVRYWEGGEGLYLCSARKPGFKPRALIPRLLYSATETRNLHKINCFPPTHENAD